MELPRANVPQFLSSNPEIEIKQYGNGFKFALLNRERKSALGSLAGKPESSAAQLESGSYFKALESSFADALAGGCTHVRGVQSAFGPSQTAITSERFLFFDSIELIIQ